MCSSLCMYIYYEALAVITALLFSKMTQFTEIVGIAKYVHSIKCTAGLLNDGQAFNQPQGPLSSLQ